MRVWLKQDSEFRKPKTIIDINVFSPITYSDPINSELSHLFAALFRDDLNEYLYAAQLAGLVVGVSNSVDGIKVCKMID